MHAYGHNRRDKLVECKYGCCTYKSGVHLNCRKVVDKQNRKSARQLGKVESAEINFKPELGLDSN